MVDQISFSDLKKVFKLVCPQYILLSRGLLGLPAVNLRQSRGGSDIWSLQVSPLCYKSVSFAVTVIYLVSLEMEQNSGSPHLLVESQILTAKKKNSLYTGSGSLHAQKYLTKLITYPC